MARKRHGGRRANRGTPAWFSTNRRFRYGTADNRWKRLELEAWVQVTELVVERSTGMAHVISDVSARRGARRTIDVCVTPCSNIHAHLNYSLRKFYQWFRKADRCMYAEHGCMRVDMAEHPRGGKHYYCVAHAPLGSVGPSTFFGAHHGCCGGECPNWEKKRYPDCEGPIASACMFDSMCGNCFGKERYPAGDGRTAAHVGGEKGAWRVCPIKDCGGTLQVQYNIGHKLTLACDVCKAFVERDHFPVKAYGHYEMIEEEVSTADGRPYPPAPQVYALEQRVVVRLPEGGAPAFRQAFEGRVGRVLEFNAYATDPMCRTGAGPLYLVQLDVTPPSWPRNPLWFAEKELAAKEKAPLHSEASVQQ